MIGSAVYVALLLAGLVLIRTCYDGYRLWPLLAMIFIVPAPLLLDLLPQLARPLGLG